MNWLYYLAEANIYLGVFYLVYCLFLNKETYYQLNRAYLLFSCVAAFILPVLQIGALKPVKTQVVNTITYALPVQHAPVVYTVVNAAPVVIEHHFSLQDGLWYAYLLGAIVLLLVLFIKLYTLFRLMRNERSVKRGKHKLIYLTDADVAFSFFNYLFIGTNAAGANTIIRHELVHIRQKHSADIIFLELLKIINWFNPFIYLLQNSLKAIHEYIADEQTAAHETDALTYSSFLVNNAYGAGGSSITHSFFNYNLLKKRIIMLNQQRSGNLARLKYLIAIPVCAGLLCASTLAFSKTYGWVDLVPQSSAGKTLMPDIAPTPKIIDKRRMPPPPMFTKNGYEGLTHHVYKTIHYNPAKNDKGGEVIVGFTVNNDHKITDVKILKGTDNKLDILTLNTFKSFNGSINGKPGEYKLNVYYYTNDYSIFKSVTNLYHTASVIGDMTFMDLPYVVKTTSKGYDYDENEWYENGKPHLNRVIIYDKNSDANIYAMPATPNIHLNKLLKDKYGYEFPKDVLPPPPPVEKNQVKFPPPVVKSNNVTTKTNVELLLSPPPIAPQQDKVVSVTAKTSINLDAFYKYLSKSIHYPAEDKENSVVGKVIARFTVNSDNKIDGADVLRSPSNSLAKEVLRVLKNCTFPADLKPGSVYVVPFSFAIKDKNDNYVSNPASNKYDTKLTIGTPITQTSATVALNEVVIFGYSLN
jgi:TonB family protein